MTVHGPDADPAMCPRCGEDRLIEWDPALRKWLCAVCTRVWVRSVHAEALRLGTIRASRWPETLLR